MARLSQAAMTTHIGLTLMSIQAVWLSVVSQIAFSRTLYDVSVATSPPRIVERKIYTPFVSPASLLHILVGSHLDPTVFVSLLLPLLSHSGSNMQGKASQTHLPNDSTSIS